MKISGLIPLCCIFCLLGNSLLALELGTCTTSRGDIHRWITVPASLTAWQRTVLVAKVTGNIRTLSVDIGDRVGAGQVLIELEVPELQAQLLKAKAKLVAAESDLKRLSQTRAKSPDLILPQDVEDARAREAGARAELLAIEAQLEFSRIRAPFDGVITRRLADLGALAVAQNTELLEVSQLHPLRLCIPVPETEAARARVGQPVRLLGESGQPLAEPSGLKLNRSALNLEIATRTLTVQADLNNEGLSRLPGSFVLAQVALEQHQGVTLAPLAALVMEKTQGVVFVHADGKAKRVPVKLGFQDGQMVELPDLKPGQQLLLPAGNALTDGAAVILKP